MRREGDGMGRQYQPECGNSFCRMISRSPALKVAYAWDGRWWNPSQLCPPESRS